MSQYVCKCYFQTGLNAVNVVDSPNLLNDATQFLSVELPTIDINQNIFLSSVRVRVLWKDIKYCDYVAIGNLEDGFFYYFVDGITMLGYDVAELSLTPDFLTSAGGIGAVDILDGIVTRCHVSDDSYGAWNIEDEFLTPSEPLLMDTHQINFGRAGNVYIESSLDLGAMASIGSSDAYVETEDESVLVPTVVTNFYDTQYYMGGNQGTPTRTTLFDASDDDVLEGVNRCRALGIESAIRSQVCIPSSLVSKSTALEKITHYAQGGGLAERLELTQISGGGQTSRYFYDATLLDGSINRQWRIIRSLSSGFNDSETDIEYEYQDVNNNRVLYGSMNRVGILTTAGNRLESNPEDTRSGDDFVTIRSVGDPHPTGCPYHRFKTMNGNSSTSAFFVNAVKGLQWKQIPLMYSEPSGNALNQIAFSNSRRMQDLEYSYTPSGLANYLYNYQVPTFNSGKAEYSSLGGGLANNNTALALSGALLSFLQNPGLGAFSSGGLSTLHTMEKYDLAKKQEMQQFAIQQSVASPEISVSYDGEAFRDFYGETVVVYRYRPTPTDIARLDTILTMYGYKVNISGKDANFFNRQYFNYVQGNLTVGGNYPKWLCDGVSMQIANGVRVWHVKPNSNYYYNNPII